MKMLGQYLNSGTTPSFMYRLLAPTSTVIHGPRFGGRIIGSRALHDSRRHTVRLLTASQNKQQEVRRNTRLLSFHYIRSIGTVELLFYCCVCIRCQKNVFTELLRSKGRLFWPHYFGLLESDREQGDFISLLLFF
jgi:hypothetical protein